MSRNAYDFGIEDYFQGVELNDNPYEEDTPEFGLWAQAWVDMDLDESYNPDGDDYVDYDDSEHLVPGDEAVIDHDEGVV